MTFNASCFRKVSAQVRLGVADPVAQRRAVEFEPLACVDLGLTIKRQMVAVLRHQ